MTSTLTFLLLSPTFGMHQYTADLAEQMANGEWRYRGAEEQLSGGTGENKSPIPIPHSPFHLVTTSTYPAHRYGPGIRIHTPITATGTGFGAEGLDIPALRRVLATLDAILAGRGSAGAEGQGGGGEFFSPPGSPIRQSPVPGRQAPIASPQSPFTVHFTGVHLWNPLLLMALRRRGVRTIHTLHDLDPHHGVRFGSLIRLWNRLVIQRADHLLVHGHCYREQLIAQGLPAHRITYTPLLHGFWGADKNEGLGVDAASAPPSSASTSASMTAIIGERLPTAVKRSTAIGKHHPLVLFFGRVEAYKGVSVLLAAWEKMVADRPGSGDLQNDAQLLLAGQVAADMPLPSLPPGVELRNRRISDEEGIDLFQRCSLVVLPYIDATQSALIAAAYFFAKPVIVTRSGALPEYVIEGKTGWVIPPHDVDHLAVALHRALADPERLGRMGLAGRLWYEQQRLLEGNTLRAMYSELSLQRS